MAWSGAVLLADGVRMAAGVLGRGLRSHRPERIEGPAEAICREVVRGCWNGRYLAAGRGHLTQMWIRDLAISLEGLLHLGERERVEATLRFALERWERAGRITTTIALGRFPVDVFTYSSDSLPFLLYTLERADLADLRAAYAPLLSAEARRYRREVIDEGTGQVRRDRVLSATKDTMHFRATCTAQCMAAWCARLLARATDIDDALTGLDLEVGVEGFWTGSFYRNDLEDGEAPLVSADAGFWPLWCDLAPDRATRLRSAMDAVRRERLDQPMPLKYHARRMPEREVLVQRAFIPNYQGDAIWTFFAAQWIELLSEVDPEAARDHARRYRAWVEAEGTWWEVLEPDGRRPLRGRFGHGSDWGMLWAASLPRVLERLGV